MITERFEGNPILTPNKEQSWEGEAVFNPCPIKEKDQIYLLYRALSLPHYHTPTQSFLKISSIGIAESKDGVNFFNRRRLIVGEKDWEKFGCEDPRITKLGRKYYIFYTALGSWPPRAETIRVGVGITDNLNTIKERYLVTPFNAKAMTLFPERISGKIWAALTVNTDKPPAEICLISFDKEQEILDQERWQKWYQNFKNYALELRKNPQDHIELGAPPIKTPRGWLLLYCYIQNYFTPERLFTVEGVLLDLKNPLKIIGKTTRPILYPEEHYEKYGITNNVIFPSGALLKKDIINLYYGAADTTCCLAKIDLNSLLSELSQKKEKKIQLKRAKENPIIKPIKTHSWENKATFNPGAIYLEGKVYLIYRAMSEDNTSSLGLAISKDGIHIEERLPEPIYVPREPFEQKLVPGANSGAEDPRLTKIGRRIYMLYTAFDGKNPPRVALTSIDEKDFLSRNWNWEKPKLISPPGFDDKDAALFPEKIKGKYVFVHRKGNDIDLSFNDDLDFSNNWLEEYRWIMPRPGWWDSLKVGIGPPPIKTKFGWLIIYHGVSSYDHHYRVGAVLADLVDPTKIICRTEQPILEPEKYYEKEGMVNNVVFPCGEVVINKTLFVYYGAGDKVVGVATVSLEKLLNSLIFNEF